MNILKKYIKIKMENGYKILKKLGEGGFGIVYLIEKDNQQYALKQYKIRLKKEEIEQYKKIINVLSKINNEYLIKYYYSFMENNIFNILMEYVGDNDLKKFIQNYKDKDEFIDEKIIRDIVIQICKGLKEIHDNKIIHRDLTPDNIFIDKNNKIKIGDFGTSKITTTSNNYSKTQIGKFNYLAPEIDKGLKYNNKVDIYSLGCIIYELFTLNEYYLDKQDEKECKIDTNLYNSKYQYLIDLLLKKDYHNRPTIDEVINNINLISENYIIAEINISEEDINKDIRIINSYEERIRHYNIRPIKDEANKYENEKEIKDNCKIKINNNYIDFNYFYKFKEKGKFIIKYLFNNNITKVDYIFNECKLLINIDLFNFNSQNITNIKGMFSCCGSLKNINLSNFNTQNVEDMSRLFWGCESLTNIDLSYFKTKNVTYISGMFYLCKSLTNLNLSNFDTKNVTNMRKMFYGCTSFTKIDLSNFDTKNVNDMSYMFCHCKALKDIDLSKFNTQYVNNMRGMFSGCESLINIDLSNFDTKNV